MCGIFGVLGPALTEHVRAHARRYATCLAHRGPDDIGWLWVDADRATVETHADGPSGASACLVHHRLTILDLSAAGHQPMASADGRVHLSFNGEIYNYLELRAELESVGVTFHSTGDSEVLLHAWRTWGRGALDRLIGMYAFAVLDLDARTLTLARDPFGIKPLYFTTAGQGFAFASELKGLLDLPGVSRCADAQQVYDYLVWNMTDYSERTFLRDVRSLPPGCVLTVGLDDGVVSEPERSVHVTPPARVDIDAGEAARQVREAFVRNIELHLRSDVRVGCALSGGIDSSAIVAGMRHVGGAALDIQCFSHIASESSISEERWIDLVGTATGATVHKVQPSADELANDLDALIRVQDEPFGSTTIYAQYRVFQLAAEHGIKVMLDGQGADEMLAGYRPYTAGRLASLCARGDVAGAWRLLAAARRFPGGAPAQYLTRALWLMMKPVVLRGETARRRIRRRPWLNGHWFAERQVMGRQAVLRDGVRESRDYLRRLLYESFVRSSLPALLRYEDRNSMAFSIESRVPFLTMPFVDLIFSLPEPLILSPDGETKHVFRRAMRGLVPDQILDRQDKIGFATPEASWLRTMRTRFEAVLASDHARAMPILDMHAVRAQWDAVMNGTRPFDGACWRWINLIRWSEERGVTFE